MMNNFMTNGLSQAFNLGGQGANNSNYAYEINLGAVNKSMNNNAQPMSGGQSRSNSHDYDNPTKAIYKGSS